MAKLNISFVFFGLLLTILVSRNHANDAVLDLSIVTDLIDVYAKQRSLILCMANSCDPLALQKIFQVDDAVEDILSSNPTYGRHDEESLKLDKAEEYSIKMILALEPKCRNPAYVCPHPVVAKVPKYVYDYTNALQEMLDAAQCITNDHVQAAIDIIGKSMEYVEQYKRHMTNYLEQMLPPVYYATNEFRKLCDK